MSNKIIMRSGVEVDLLNIKPEQIIILFIFNKINAIAIV